MSSAVQCRVFDLKMQGLGSGVVKAGCHLSNKGCVALHLNSGYIHAPLKFSVPGMQWRQLCAFSKRRKEHSLVVRAGGNPEETSKPIAPLQMESPTGQLLSQLLKDHPHLLPAAAEQQLESLIADRDAAAQQEPPTTSGTELVLYRRIAELKAAERRKALEETLYALIVQKFMDAGISLISSVSEADPVTGRVDTWPKQDHKLERVHSPEAFEMIKNHLSLVLGNRLLDTNAIAQISKLRVGQVYAASVMYGYFLRRVDQRFQLEKNMKMLPFGSNEGGDVSNIRADEFKVGDLPPEVTSASGLGSEEPTGSQFSNVSHCKLRAYVVSFDQNTLQRYATMRSKEGVGIIERHSEALFGRPEIQIVSGSVAASNDEVIQISFSGLTSLVLEAVTFGSFLWDVESYVDSREHYVTTSSPFLIIECNEYAWFWAKISLVYSGGTFGWRNYQMWKTQLRFAHEYSHSVTNCKMTPHHILVE